MIDDTTKPKPARVRDEDRAWYDLAFALRGVSTDAPGPAGIDYERAANRVQCSSTSPEDVMIAQALRGAGHVRPDPVTERLALLSRRDGSARVVAVLVWLRAFGPALDWLRADAVHEKRAALLDALALTSGVATTEDMQRWAIAGTGGGGRRGSTRSDAPRAWARLRLREAWAAWFG